MPSEEQLVPFFTTLVCRGPGSNPWPPVPQSGHSTNWAIGAGLRLVSNDQELIQSDPTSCLSISTSTHARQGYILSSILTRFRPRYCQMPFVLWNTENETKCDQAYRTCFDSRELVNLWRWLFTLPFPILEKKIQNRKGNHYVYWKPIFKFLKFNILRSFVAWYYYLCHPQQGDHYLGIVWSFDIGRDYFKRIYYSCSVDFGISQNRFPAAKM